MTDVVAGRIAGLFGIHGELKCDPSAAGRTVVCAGAALRCVRDGRESVVRIEAARPHKGRLLIRIGGVADSDAGAAYVGAVLYAPREAIALSEGEYLDDDLVGCTVRDRDGASYGTVERVEHFPASDMLVVEGTMVPMVGPIVTRIDVAARQIVIDPPAGLIEPR